jgi:hypothetical protein
VVRVSLQYLWGNHRRDEIHHPPPWEFHGGDEHAIRVAVLTLGTPDIASSGNAKLLIEDETGLVGGWDARGAKRLADYLAFSKADRADSIASLCLAIRDAVGDNPKRR